MDPISIIGIIVTIALAYAGSIEIRMRKLNEKPSRREVAELIDLKQEAVKAIQEEIKEDTAEIKKKLDRLEDYLLNNNR